MPDDRSGSPFRELHNRARAFIIPNPWDVGSAKILAAMGFEALATTSAGFANSRGRKDGGITSAEMLEHCRDIVAATPLPVSADLEKGIGRLRPMPPLKPFARPRAQVSPAPRLRISPVIAAGRSSTSAWRPSGSRRQARPRGGLAAISS